MTSGKSPRLTPKIEELSSTAVYLTGPMGRDDWRYQLVPDLRKTLCKDVDEASSVDARYDTSLTLRTITAGFNCVGSWNASWGHGLIRGPFPEDEAGDCYFEEWFPSEEREQIFRTNMERIRRADAVFSYVNRDGAYGTMFELGVAQALGIPTYVAFPHNVAWRGDMWFAAQGSANSSDISSGSLDLAWDAFCGWWLRQKVRRHDEL